MFPVMPNVLLIKKRVDFFLLRAGLIWDRDHSGGNEEIKKLMPGIRVFGGTIDNVRGCTERVENGDSFTLGADINILSLHTPWYVIAFW